MDSKRSVDNCFELDRRLIDPVSKSDSVQTKSALDDGAWIEARDFAGWTPLGIASDEGAVACVRILIAAGAKVDGVATGADTAYNPAHLAARSASAHSAECLSILRLAGADLNARNAKGATPLMLAIREGRLASALELIESGADLDAQDNQGCSALRYAAACARSECLLALVGAGADLARAGSFGAERDMPGFRPTPFEGDTAAREECAAILLAAREALELRLGTAFAGGPKAARLAL